MSWAIRSWWKNLDFGWQLLIGFTCLPLVPVLLIGFLGFILVNEVMENL